MHLKRNDFLIVGVLIVALLPFFLFSSVYDWYKDFNDGYPLIMGAIKFALLATFGECLAMRMREGRWNKPGFGVVIRMLIWAFLGAVIVAAMMIFKTGVPVVLTKMGVADASVILAGGFTLSKVGVAFAISVFMNTIFAPVFMTFHKITDMHIANTGGTVPGFFKNKLNFAQITQNISWHTQFNFVFFKTIPFFWFPAHTITFLLPADMQVLFAAALSVALGVILALASMMSKNNQAISKKQ